MTPITEKYQRIFNAPGGKDVLADLSRFVQRLPPAERGAASLVMLRIQQMMVTEAGPQGLHLRGPQLAGGRIAHGSG